MSVAATEILENDTHRKYRHTQMPSCCCHATDSSRAVTSAQKRRFTKGYPKRVVVTGRALDSLARIGLRSPEHHRTCTLERTTLLQLVALLITPSSAVVRQGPLNNLVLLGPGL